jgi:hypothetical protein
MTIWRHFIVTGFLLAAGATGAQAQTIAALVNQATVTLDGLTATITALSCPTNGCSSGDELEVVSPSRDNLVFEVVNSGATTSSIFSAPSSAETMTFTLTISPVPNYGHALGSVTSASTTATGYAAFNCSSTGNGNGGGGGENKGVCSSLSGPTASSSFIGTQVAPSPLTDTLPIQYSVTSFSGGTQESNSASSTGFGTTNSFSDNVTLTLDPSSNPVERLEFDAFALQLHSVPEPATAAILLASLTGLAMARRRRQT